MNRRSAGLRGRVPGTMGVHRVAGVCAALFGLAAPTVPGNAGSLSAQTPAVPAPVTASTTAAPVPFGPGERLIYKVKWGIFNLGTGRLSVEGIETVRGRPAYNLELRLVGGKLGLTVDDTQNSWLDVETLASRRFRQDRTVHRRDSPDGGGLPGLGRGSCPRHLEDDERRPPRPCSRFGRS